MKKENTRKKHYTPSKEELRNAIESKMSELGLWNEDLVKDIPTYWENFHNFVIFSDVFFAADCWLLGSPVVWESISKLFGGKSIAVQGKIKSDDFRSPSAKVVYGDSPWAEIHDNGIVYRWNVEFTMFCSGNVTERHRVGKLDCRGSVVVDMFAGIGYFTVPYLVHANAAKVIACEWNPASVEALTSNLSRNKVADKCEVLEGDIRTKCPRGIADHINMGLIPSCEEYWPTAAQVLKQSGGVVHVHGNVTSFSRKQSDSVSCVDCQTLTNQLFTIDKDSVNSFSVTSLNNDLFINVVKDEVEWKKNQDWICWAVHVSHRFCQLLTELHNCKWEIRPINLHKVKPYAPHIDHLVLDISCRNLQHS